jgi:3-dehydroquinate synthase
MVNSKLLKQKHIYIGSSALLQFNKILNKNNYKQFIIVCDENTFKHCLPLLIAQCPKLVKANVFEIEPGEVSKSLNIAAQFWQTLVENKIEKDALIINLGGGVVCDLGGFCAAIYKRGIDFMNVPTSLLAMADASVGSKTGIDFEGVKNILGSFYQPKAVFIEPLFLITLPNSEMKNGLTEIVKMALISDSKFWQQLNNPQTSIDEKLIEKAILIKSKIVIKDPYDKGIRQTLNYGHSIGHAIESLTLNTIKPLMHGEAVLIGMIIENHISYQKKILKKEVMNEINHFLVSNFKPACIPKNNLNPILAFLINDKKNKNAKFMFSLLEKIGACKINVEVTTGEIKKALQYYEKLVE